MQIVKSDVLALREDFALLGEVKLGMTLALSFKLVQHLVQFEEDRI